MVKSKRSKSNIILPLITIDAYGGKLNLDKYPQFLDYWSSSQIPEKNLLLKRDNAKDVDPEVIANFVTTKIKARSKNIKYIVHIRDCFNKGETDLYNEIYNNPNVKHSAIVLYDICIDRHLGFLGRVADRLLMGEPPYIVVILKYSEDKKDLPKWLLKLFDVIVPESIEKAIVKRRPRISDKEFKQICKEVEKESPRELVGERKFFKELSKMSKDTKYDKSGRGYKTWQSAKKRYYKVFPSKRADQ